MRVGGSLAAAAALVLTISSASAALKQGSIDPRFGSHGFVRTPLTAGFDDVSRIAVLPNGKILVAGGANRNFFLLRYLANGRLDRSFGSGGKVITDFLGGNDGVRGLVVQPDGKIVLGGFAQVSGVLGFALARYSADGHIDTSFGSSGKVTTSFGSTSFAEGLVLLPGGKLLAVGAIISGSQFDTALARYKPNGSLDTSFGTGGRLQRDLNGGDDDLLYSIVRYGSGIVAGGLAGTSTFDDTLVARFDADGHLVSSFGSGGLVTVDFAGFADQLRGVTTLPGGDIVGVGYAGNGTAYDSALIELKPNGALDHRFSGDGKATFSAGATDTLDGVTVLPGLYRGDPVRIAASGSANTATSPYRCSALVVKLNGELDRGFASRGIFQRSFATTHDTYCSHPAVADRLTGGRDLLLVGGDDLTTSNSEPVSVEVFADPVGTGCPPTRCRFYKGTARGNRITGTKGRDLMLGLGGNDRLDGRAGRNVLNGGREWTRASAARRTAL